MIRITLLILGFILTSLSGGTAVAADQKQCADQFKAADINNDGIIVRSLGSFSTLTSNAANRQAFASP